MTTHYTSGVTNVAATSAMGRLKTPDPTKYHTWFDDFDDYAATDWIITTTEAGAGNATEAINNEDGGVLLITNDDADDDADFFQYAGVDSSAAVETFKWESGKQLAFKARFKVSDATQSDFIMGLQITDTTPLDVTDGFFFIKSDGSTSITFRSEKNNTADTVTVGTCTTSYMVLAFFYDPVDQKFHVFMDDVEVGTCGITNACDDEELTVSFGIQNGEAVAKTMSVDYIYVAKER